MRSKLFTWLSHRLLRLSIAGLLAFLLVGGVALKSGEFFHPKPAHAAASSAVAAKRAVALCLMQGLTMGAVAGIASDILIPVKLVQYVRKAAAVRFAVNAAAEATAAEGLEVSQATLSAYWARNGNIVTSNAVGNCLGFTFFNLYGPLAQQLFPDDIGNPRADSDGAAFAEAVTGNPSVLCQNAIGPAATLDDSGLCYNPDNQTFYSVSGTAIGPDRCAANGGVAPVYNEASGYCTDDQGLFYSPMGGQAGRCVLGVPEGNGVGNCVDPANGQKYDQAGNSLTPPQADSCTEALVGSGGNLADCSYGYIPVPLPTDTPTPQPPPSDPAGTWNYTINFPSPNNTITYQSGTMTITAGSPYTASCTVSSETPYTKMQACDIDLDNPNQWQRNLAITPQSSTFILELTGGSGFIEEYFLFGPIALSGASATTGASSATGMAGYILTMTRA